MAAARDPSVVKFSIPRNFEGTNKTISSGDFAQIFNDLAIVLDFVLTYGYRYERLPGEVAHLGGDGPSFEFNQQNPEFAASVLVITWGIALLNMRQTIIAMQKEKERRNAKAIYEKLGLLLPAPVPAEVEPSERAKRISDLLNEQLNNHHDLCQKYTAVTVEPLDDEFEVQFTPVPAEPFWSVSTAKKVYKKSEAIVDAGFDSLGIMAYMYWILFATVAVALGTFAVVAAPWLVAIPFAVGAVYLGLKGYRFYKHKKTNREERDDFTALVKEAVLQDEELEALGERLKFVPSKQTAMHVTPKDVVLAAGLGFVGTYVIWQYIMWYVTDTVGLIWDIAKTLPGVSEAIGIGILVFGAVSLIRAGYNAYQTYQKGKKQLHSMEALPEVDAEGQFKDAKYDGEYIWVAKKLYEVKGKVPSLVKGEFSTENDARAYLDKLNPPAEVSWKECIMKFKFSSTILLERQRADVKSLEHQLSILMEKGNDGVDVPAHVTASLDKEILQIDKAERAAQTADWKQKLRNNVGHIGNFFMTGAFVLRTVLIPSTTPFIIKAVAGAVLGAAALSNPAVTLAIIFAFAIVVAVHTYYAYRTKKNAEKLRNANQHAALLERKIEFVKKYKKKSKLGVLPSQVPVAVSISRSTIAGLDSKASASPSPLRDSMNSSGSISSVVPASAAASKAVAPAVEAPSSDVVELGGVPKGVLAKLSAVGGCGSENNSAAPVAAAPAGQQLVS